MNNKTVSAFNKSAAVKAYIIKMIFEKRSGNIPTSEELAAKFGANVNTVKKVIKDLAKEGYIKTNKKAGTAIKTPIPTEASSSFKMYMENLISLIMEMKSSGLGETEVESIFINALSENKKAESNIIYIDTSPESLIVGKAELETKLGFNITTMLLEDFLRKYEKIKGDDKIFITTYICFQHLVNRNINENIIPLKITPPLDLLVNFDKIPIDTNVVSVVLSEQIQERIYDVYGLILEKFRNFKIYTLSEVKRKPVLLDNCDLLLTLKSIYRENEEYFSKVSNVITYNRFHDDEGIELIKSYLKRP
ncbi:GntR family transcriptional regulator [Flexistipes sinusarabici]|uniref:GntR family transcriptional regulator n=1 Tax=Flexistipes sinusarabici TaxID=2352 RepID=UPI0023574800|nr:GntR family transcriptional regulator [Flexistipes sinusarabici]